MYIGEFHCNILQPRLGAWARHQASVIFALSFEQNGFIYLFISFIWLRNLNIAIPGSIQYIPKIKQDKEFQLKSNTLMASV